MTATLSVLFSMSQSLSEGAETGASLREFGPLLVCPKPLFGRSAVDSASGSCCGAVATNRTKVKKEIHDICENGSSNVTGDYAGKQRTGDSQTGLGVNSLCLCEYNQC